MVKFFFYLLLIFAGGALYLKGYTDGALATNAQIEPLLKPEQKSEIIQQQELKDFEAIAHKIENKNMNGVGEQSFSDDESQIESDRGIAAEVSTEPIDFSNEGRDISSVELEQQPEEEIVNENE